VKYADYKQVVVKEVSVAEENDNSANKIIPVEVVNLNIVRRDIMDTCCICVDEFENAPADELLVETECNHLFHERCLRQWVETRLKPNARNQILTPECPCCRVEIKLL
jgi:hypothetical protein